ncbi:MAG: MiaB/RimO family radical SAM methylthiotransferase [Planctomycetota bacterium]|jgi:threonylcarbamoyladenosine tRNA methylthiotransferase MtaB
MPMPAYRVVALGCKVSRADAAGVERALIGAGLGAAREGEEADVCVVCGCAVTSVAEGKSRRAVRRARRENPGATVVAAGCIAAREETSREAGADVLLPPGGAECVTDVLRSAGRMPETRPAPEGAPEGFPGRTRAFLKVQDGCDGSCAYCIVPALRGASRSRALDEVMEEARGLVRAGHAEIVLAGVRLGRYRSPEGGAGRADVIDLVALVEALLMLRGSGLRRLRLSSIEPLDFDLRLAEIASAGSGLCAHVHLPLQSASDAVLERMKRPYRVADYREIVGRARGSVPDAGVTTDVIAGFPGETADDHARTRDFIREAGFARVHAFPFSPRPGTPAAEMAGAVPVGTARARAGELIEAGARSAREYRARFVGRELEVIAQPGPGEGRLSGYTDRYVSLAFDGPADLVGRVVRVRALAESGAGLEGELVQ